MIREILNRFGWTGLIIAFAIEISVLYWLIKIVAHAFKAITLT